MELAPFLWRPLAGPSGCRGFIGPYPSTPLDANGYVWSRRITASRMYVELQVSQVIGCESRIKSEVSTNLLDDPLRRNAEPSEATVAPRSPHTGRFVRLHTDPR